MRTVAVVGLGAMGRRIARRLLDAGFDVVVWNRTPERTAELVSAGASAASTPAEAARQADAVITMVAHPAALRAVTEGPDGICAAAGPKTTAIEMSTVGPSAVQRLRSTLPAEAALVDAPVLGSLGEAEAGNLSIFAGGDAEDVAQIEPLLSHLGTLLHVGPLGAGAAAKLVANATLFAALAGLGEALSLGAALGLSRENTFRVLARTPLAEQAERRREAFERNEYPLRFSLSLARKDAELMAEAAASAGVELRLVAAAASWLAEAETAGLGAEDYSAVLAFIDQRGKRGEVG